MRPTTLTCACIAATALALGGCTETRRALGLEKNPPDEFAVVSRAPLSLPPEYTLRPPQPGAARPQDTTPQQQARQTVFRAPEPRAIEAQPAPRPENGNRSVGEQALLRGAGSADPEIRRLVNQETARLVEADRSFLDRLIFWQKPQPPGTVVDPTKEAQRLRENAALGKPANEGETPTIQRRKRALLEGIF